THAAGSAPVRASMPRVGFTGAPAAGGNGAAASSTSRIPPPPIPPPPPDEPYAPPVRGRVTTNPITLAPGAALDQVSLSEVMVGAEIERRGDGLSSGVILIPLDDFADDTSPFEIEAVTVPDEHDTVDVSIEAVESAGDEPSFEEIAVEDLPDAEDGDSYGFLPVPRSLSAAARRALAATPLLAGLGSDALAVMVARLDLVHLKPGEVLFREGDPGDTLYVVSEGEVAVMAEGPPRKELSRLLPGAFFGEVALITDQPRSASIVAVAATELLAIDRAVIAELVSQHPDVLRVILRFIKNRLVERVIQTSPLFEPFPERERRALADRFDFLEIEPDTGLIGQGTRPDGLYVLLAGRAEVLHTDHGGGRPRSLGFLGPGEVFGEAALWGSEASLATVQTRGKVLALRMPSGTFREVVMTHPQVMEYVGELAELRRVAIESPRSVVDRKLDLL
ncbi:MAG: cyclic nucleotide-binding domain-containing protein, partial [Myxococcales bacterium]|nr:cyclic nucleotide-binding domain-containing protein [Myxococcales bacterium]